ncbi:MAG: DNA replication and repair protein RecF [Candidatus Levybacteria bacterium]|nr:DNA replication and repair protein RecF [Candidatus Levybacteria bacterium]
MCYISETMSLASLKLKNFRNHKKASFSFPLTTVIIGRNTVGKTSILEAIQFLSLGKSFKAERDMDAISEGQDFSRIEATVIENDGKVELVAILAKKENPASPRLGGRFSKKFMVNNVARRLVDFSARFPSVLFTPEDLEIITDSPSVRRNYINSILIQTDKRYRVSLGIYEKAIRHRNRMLWLHREGKKYFGPAEFEYWDNIVIQNGNIVTETREKLIEHVNNSEKEVFPFEIYYDKSTITSERLEKYHDAERASATTLVGPQRDDFFFRFRGTEKAISEFGSRGEQRLTIFQMKILETFYIREKTGITPTLLLDDIFSELDTTNIHRVLDLLPHQQTIITTTHKEFVPKKILDKEEVEIIEL